MRRREPGRSWGDRPLCLGSSCSPARPKEGRLRPIFHWPSSPELFHSYIRPLVVESWDEDAPGECIELCSLFLACGRVKPVALDQELGSLLDIFGSQGFVGQSLFFDQLALFYHICPRKVFQIQSEIYVNISSPD